MSSKHHHSAHSRGSSIKTKTRSIPELFLIGRQQFGDRFQSRGRLSCLTLYIHLRGALRLHSGQRKEAGTFQVGVGMLELWPRARPGAPGTVRANLREDLLKVRGWGPTCCQGQVLTLNIHPLTPRASGMGTDIICIQGWGTLSHHQEAATLCPTGGFPTFQLRLPVSDSQRRNLLCQCDR